MKNYTVDEFESNVKAVFDKIDYGFDEKYAICYGISQMDDNSFDIVKLASDNDVYMLLDALPSMADLVSPFDFIGVMTCGWAAPTDDNEDIAPSKHPERRRVTLGNYLSISGLVGSVIQFKPDYDGMDDEPAFDFGKATGPLAFAIRDLIEELKTR